MDTLEALRLYVAIAETGSLSAAARQVSVSTSTVTFAGWNTEAGVSTASMTTVFAAWAGAADIPSAMAATTASSAYDILRINGSPPLDHSP